MGLPPLTCTVWSSLVGVRECMVWNETAQQSQTYSLAVSYYWIGLHSCNSESGIGKKQEERDSEQGCQPFACW
ncbi:hypothetical protein DL96DRAFT_1654579 [Flagelloscypha sp. PMI_526]|nr:hypothetical protein DL96DRAFT_1654579 [Flagelloscypha sp. PMI_526]